MCLGDEFFQVFLSAQSVVELVSNAPAYETQVVVITLAQKRNEPNPCRIEPSQAHQKKKNLVNAAFGWVSVRFFGVH